MQRQFYVSHDGQVIGSYSPEDILKKVTAGELQITDYIYDESKGDWVLMVEAAELQSMMQTVPKKQESVQVSHPIPAIDEWFVLKGENQTGPFPFKDLIAMLQEKVIFEFDYIWKQGMESWKRIAEMTEFSPENIKSLKEQSHDFRAIFFRRKFKRREFSGTLIIHDNKKVWHGKGLEISEAGAGLVMYNAMILPGQTLYVHFRPSTQVPAFNALVEVVSKKYVKGANSPESAINYGVRFVRIQEEAKKSLQSFVSEKKEAA